MRTERALLLSLLLGGCGWLSDAEVEDWLDGQLCAHGATEPDAPDCELYFEDDDGDGFGSERFECRCGPSLAFPATVPGDCDDGDPAVHPGALEVCDDRLVDEDCDATTPNGEQLWFLDRDGDGYGTSSSQLACAPVGEFTSTTTGDCDDGDPRIRQGAPELCDGLDNDCNPDTTEDGLVTVFVEGAEPVSFTGELQEAVDHAGALDTAAVPEVVVCPGTYGAVVVARSLVLRGRGDPNTVVLDAAHGLDDPSAAVSVVTVAGEALTLENLTLTGGRGTPIEDGQTSGGGLLVIGGTPLDAHNIVITGNRVEGRGGAIYTTGPLELDQSLIFDNSARTAGGAIYATGDRLTLTDGNLFFNQSDRGAGIAMDDAVLTLDNTRVSGNVGDVGGGVYVSGDEGSRIEGGEISSNSARVQGGGVVLNAPGATLVLDGVSFSDNVVLQESGGGIVLLEGDLEAVDCDFVEDSPETCPRANYPDDVYVDGEAWCAGDGASFQCEDGACGCLDPDAPDCTADTLSRDCDCIR